MRDLRFDAAIQEHVLGDLVQPLVQTVVPIRVDDMDALLRGALHLAVPVPLQFLRALQGLPREPRILQPIMVVLPADEVADGAAEARRAPLVQARRRWTWPAPASGVAAVIQCEPGTGPVAVSQASNLTRLPFGQLLVINPRSPREAPRAPLSCEFWP